MVNAQKDYFGYMAGGKYYDIDQAGSSMFYLTSEPPEPYFQFNPKHISLERANFALGSDVLKTQFDLLEKWFYIDKKVHNRFKITIQYTINDEFHENTIYADGDGDPDHSFGATSVDGFGMDEAPTGSIGDYGVGTKEEGLAGLVGDITGSLVGIPAPFGTIIGVIAYDTVTGQQVSTGMIGKAITENAISTVSSAISSAFGFTGVVGLAVSFGIATTLTEAFEVAVGLDESFGFGGEAISIGSLGHKTNDDGSFAYGPAISIGTAFKTAIGQKMTGLLGLDWGTAEQVAMNAEAGYTQDDVSSAMEQSVASATADNPNHSIVGLDGGEGGQESTTSGTAELGENRDGFTSLGDVMGDVGVSGW